MDEFNYSVNKTNNSFLLKQYIYRIGSYHYNWHHQMELLVVLNGSIEVCANNSCKILETDDVVLINSNSGHATLAHEPDSIVMLLHIDPTFFNGYYKNSELLSFDLCTTKKTRYYNPFILIRSHLAEMILSCKNKGPEFKLLFDSKFYSLMNTIIQHFPPTEIHSEALISNQKQKSVVEKMVKFIDNNYEKKITLELLAKECEYNSNYVSQLFKTSIGINFYDYLTRIRLREATRDLSQTDNKVLDIALENGFSDIKSFNAAFKSNFGKPPTEYRKKLNKEIGEVDVNFKKKFISTNDTLVNNKLNEYIVFNNSSTNDSLNNVDKSNELKEQITQISEKLKELSENLNEVITN